MNLYLAFNLDVARNAIRMSKDVDIWNIAWKWGGYNASPSELCCYEMFTDLAG